jgi:hypothetical protein
MHGNTPTENLVYDDDVRSFQMRFVRNLSYYTQYRFQFQKTETPVVAAYSIHIDAVYEQVNKTIKNNDLG